MGTAFTTLAKSGTSITRGKWVAWFILTFSILMTIWVWHIAKTNSEQRAHEHFNFRVGEIESAIRQRMLAYEQVLRGGLGLFAASHTVTREEWRAYVHSLKIEQNYPGIQGIGFSKRVSQAEKDDHIQKFRVEGFPRYTIWPEGERTEYTSIIYLEPFSGRNLRALGYDMFSEPIRRTAMVRARDSGITTISGKVTLVQETDKDVQASFLMYLPVYRNGQPLETVEKRRAALLGYVYSPFRINDLMRGILGRNIPDLTVKIFDSTEASEQAQLFESDLTSGRNHYPAFTAATVVNIGGRTWSLHYSSLPAFEASIEKTKPRILLTAGAIISFLLFAVTWSLITNRARALELANDMTQAMRRAELQYHDLVESVQAIFWRADLNTSLFTFISKNAETILGYRVERWLTEPTFWQDHIHPEDREWAVTFCMKMAREKGYYEFEYRMIAADDRVVWLRDIVRVIAENGQPKELIGVMIDITERKRAEAELVLLASFPEENPNPIIEIGLDGAVNYINPAAHLHFPDVPLAGFRHPIIEDLKPLVAGLQNRQERFLIREVRFNNRIYEQRIVLQSNVIRLYMTEITGLKRAEEALQKAHDELEIRVQERTAELAKAVEELRESEERFRTMADSAPVMIWVSGTDKLCNYFNKVWLEFTGRTMGQEVGNGWAEGVHPDDLERCLNTYVTAFDARQEFKMEYRLRQFDGECRWILDNGTPRFLPDGSFAGYIGSCIDINERKRAEEALKESLIQLSKKTRYDIIIRTITQSVHQSIKLETVLENAIKAVKENVDGVNTAAIYMVEGKEAILKSYTGLPHWYIEQAGSILYPKGFTWKTMIEGQSIYCPDVEHDAFIGPAGRQLGIMSYFCTPIRFKDEIIGTLNITSSHKNGFDEEELNLLKTVAQQIEIAINNAKQAEQLRGKKEELETLNQTLEQRVAERTQELARSNAELEQFAYVASHDLQEPLRMIASYVQLLERRYRDKLDDSARDYIAFAVDGAKRMQALITDLLAYSRVGTCGKSFEPTGCESVLDSALANLQVAIKESGAVVTHDPLPTVTADVSQLVQLFQNLISNAIKFRNNRRPEIHISAKRIENFEDTKSGVWLFSVRDNGIGIEPQYAERIFVIFQRLHTRSEYPGTGMGLAICKKIVERHRGKIWVESEQGKGSTFYFTIPDRDS